METGTLKRYTRILMTAVLLAAVVYVAFKYALPLLLPFLFSGLYGALCMGGTVVYELEDWPLLRVSLTHYLICIVPYLPISLLLGWNSGIAELLIVMGVMTVVYFIIWLIMFLRYRAEVRELNDINRRAAQADADPANTAEHTEYEGD